MTLSVIAVEIWIPSLVVIVLMPAAHRRLRAEHRAGSVPSAVVSKFREMCPVRARKGVLGTAS